MNSLRKAAVLLGVTVGISAAVPVMAQHGRSESESRLKATIDRAIHEEGPFFEPSERALIERKCGYAPGAWDGNNISMSNGILTCSNGRRVDDREVRAMMEVAGERIGRRVSAVMERPEIRAAITAVAQEASARALAELGSRRRERRRER